MYKCDGVVMNALIIMYKCDGVVMNESVANHTMIQTQQASNVAIFLLFQK